MELIQGGWEALRTCSLQNLGHWSNVLIALPEVQEGPSVTLAAGAVAAKGILCLERVPVSAAASNFTSYQFWHWLGRLGGAQGYLRRFRWFRQRTDEIAQIESGIQEHAVKMYLMARLSIGLLAIPTLMSADLARVAWWRLAGVSVVIELIWTGFLVFTGYRLEEHIARLERGLEIAALVAGCVLLLALLYWYRRAFQRINEARKAGLSTMNE